MITTRPEGSAKRIWRIDDRKPEDAGGAIVGVKDRTVVGERTLAGRTTL